MDAHTIEVSRYAYAILAVLCSTGFVATLVIRWDVLARGERILRGGLILEHLVIFYGAYVAISHHLTGSVTAPLLVLSMLIMLVGFADWVVNDLAPLHRSTTS
jgi:hypothetical protein